MTTFHAVSPRRLTGREEAELVEGARRVASAEEELSRLTRAHDRLILDVVQAGARVTDVADVLNISRNAVYAAVKRALRRP
jgi:sugar-specific transcriptional regulator TrmB